MDTPQVLLEHYLALPRRFRLHHLVFPASPAE